MWPRALPVSAGPARVQAWGGYVFPLPRTHVASTQMNSSQHGRSESQVAPPPPQQTRPVNGEVEATQRSSPPQQVATSEPSTQGWVVPMPQLPSPQQSRLTVTSGAIVAVWPRQVTPQAPQLGSPERAVQVEGPPPVSQQARERVVSQHTPSSQTSPAQPLGWQEPPTQVSSPAQQVLVPFGAVQ